MRTITVKVPREVEKRFSFLGAQGRRLGKYFGRKKHHKNVPAESGSYDTPTSRGEGMRERSNNGGKNRFGRVLYQETSNATALLSKFSRKGEGHRSRELKCFEDGGHITDSDVHCRTQETGLRLITKT